MGALKDHLVDPKALPGGPVDRLVGLVGPLVGPKALPADRVGHLGGLAGLLAGPKDRLVDRAAHLVDLKDLPVDQAGRPQGLADLLVDPEVHPAKPRFLVGVLSDGYSENPQGTKSSAYFYFKAVTTGECFSPTGAGRYSLAE